ncbi:Zn-dependent M28 family amino/carboxypeptidase [Pseudomonas nitritireducens]|uniref:Zn-dependent M28 family amino/carboxypeptidase n=1 Tax=Pseudomonas nitroreducens TaxID=46680 RepID=A0A7W7KFN4_PSENT|nr:M28 family peptidase [Pseudomonas nitritireducens]MBB4861941.1 Zn-dependent M28 family amino/carboxypeptidase [Pseudomonas nitritireducens]
MKMLLHSLYLVVGGLAVFSMVAGFWVVQPGVRPVASTPPAVDALALQRHVRQLAEEFYPRSADQLANLEAAARYIEAQFREVGAEVTLQRYRAGMHDYVNVVARFGPAQGPLVVVGAHYDSHGEALPGQGYSRETHTPGADDNASGVAGLLELARLLQADPPPVGVELVAYSLEEPPNYATDAMGSVAHARALRASGRPLRLMLALEMIGYFDSTPGSQHYPSPLMKAFYPDAGDFIALVGRPGDVRLIRETKAVMAGASDLPVRSMNAPRQLEGVDFSDHRSYWDEGFAALMVTDTAFFRNEQYHLAGDTADRLDYGRMAKVVQGVFEVIRQQSPAK